MFRNKYNFIHVTFKKLMPFVIQNVAKIKMYLKLSWCCCLYALFTRRPRTSEHILLVCCFISRNLANRRPCIHDIFSYWYLNQTNPLNSVSNIQIMVQGRGYSFPDTQSCFLQCENVIAYCKPKFYDKMILYVLWVWVVVLCIFVFETVAYKHVSNQQMILI